MRPPGVHAGWPHLCWWGGVLWWRLAACRGWSQRKEQVKRLGWGCVHTQLGCKLRDMEATTTRRAARIIRHKANELGLSIAELSRRSGLSYESTRRKITGQGPLTVEELVALSSAVECSAGEVLMRALAQTSPTRGGVAA